MIVINRNSRILFWLAVFAAIGFIYYPLMKIEPISGRDDTLLLAPLAGIQDFGSFLRYLVSRENADVQPIRDISLMLDMLVARGAGTLIFHLHNVLLWCCCSFLVGRVFRRLCGESLIVYAATAAFALHPMMVMTVGWISARKHILAFLFFLLALDSFLVWVESRKRAWGVFGFYLLSVLSQPIFVFLPVWNILYLRLRGEGARAWREPLLPALLLAMACLVAVNYFHYQYLYRGTEEAVAALSYKVVNPFGDVLLALGRYTWNVLVPGRYTLFYARGSLPNLAGLVLLVLIGVFFVRELGKKTALLWLSLGLISLVIVLLKIRNIFISDTYALAYAFVFMVLFLQAGALSRHREKVAITFAFLSVCFLFDARVEAHQWTDDLYLWGRAYEYEGDCQSTMAYAQQLLIHHRPQEFLPVTRKYWELDCPNQIFFGRLYKREAFQLMLLAIFYDQKLNLEEKRDLISRRKRDQRDFLAMLYLFSLEVDAGNYEAARALIEGVSRARRNFLGDLESFELDVFQPRLEIFAEISDSPIAAEVVEQLAKVWSKPQLGPQPQGQPQKL